MVWPTALTRPQAGYTFTQFPLNPPVAARARSWVANVLKIVRQSPKLHGSLNWRYSGVGGPPNDTIWDIGIEGSEVGSRGAGPRYADAERAYD